MSGQHVLTHPLKQVRDWTTLDAAGLAAVLELARMLDEATGAEHFGLRYVVSHIGPERALELARDAIAAPEMLRRDGTPRTVGGRFFHLYKSKLDDQGRKTYARFAAMMSDTVRMPAQTGDVNEAEAHWALKPTRQRVRAHHDLANYKRVARAKVKSATATVTGTVKVTERHERYVLLTFKPMHVPSLPKGTPEAISPVTILAVVTAKAWAKLQLPGVRRDTLRILVKGVPVPVAAGICVWASDVQLLNQEKSSSGNIAVRLAFDGAAAGMHAGHKFITALDSRVPSGLPADLPPMPGNAGVPHPRHWLIYLPASKPGDVLPLQLSLSAWITLDKGLLVGWAMAMHKRDTSQPLAKPESKNADMIDAARASA
jgi:hypothetical protein